MVDGTDVIPMATSQDHKHVGEDILGLTRAVCAYSPAPVVTDADHDRVMSEIIHPTVNGMLGDGNRYRGFLYAGLMIDASGAPKVIRRFGDPETQPIMMRLSLTLRHTASLPARDAYSARPSLGVAIMIGVVLASEHYPSSSPTGLPITGLGIESQGVKVFHAGTAIADDATVTSGGRVLCVTARGASLGDAATAHTGY